MAQQTLNTPRETTHQRIADALEDIVDKIVDTSSAGNIDYDNTESGLDATKVQGAVDELASEKVDKVQGKGLSTNDYTDTEKQKLAGIEAEANKTVVDSAMSDSSTNPLQNRVVNAFLNEKTDISNFNALTQEIELFNTYDLSNDVEISVFANDTYKRDKYDRAYETHIPNLDGEYSVSLGDKTFTETCTFTIANQGTSITEVFHTNRKYILGAKLLKAENDEVGDMHVIADVVTLIISKDAPYTTTFDPYLKHPPVTGVLTLKVSVKPDEKYVTGTNEPAFWGSYNGSDLLINNPILTYSETTFGQPKVSGNPITINDAAEANAVDVSVNIEPLQDLHGYDHPWVGGAGKNKLPMTVDGIKSANTSGTWSGNVYTLSGVTFTIQTDSDGNVTGIKANGTATVSVTFNIFNGNAPLNGSYMLWSNSFLANGRAAYTFNFSTHEDINIINTREVTDTFTNDALTHMHIFIWSGTQLNNVTFQPMIAFSSESSTFAPYTNICPISGRTEENIIVSRPNLYIDGTIEFKEATAWTHDNTETAQSITGISASGNVINGTPSTGYFWMHIPFSFRKNRTVYLKFNETPATSMFRISNSNGQYITHIDTKDQYTPSEDFDGFIDLGHDSALFTNYKIGIGYTSTFDIDAYNEKPPKTYTIQLGDTIYGGTLDVTKGKMAVDRGYVDLGDLTWDKSSYINTGFYASLSYRYASDTVMVASSYNYLGTTEVGTSILPLKPNGTLMCHYETQHVYEEIYIRDDRYTDASTFKTAVTGQTLVYELATPFTIDLTPQQIRLLKGINNISCNTGDLSIKYYPDNVLGQLKGDIEDEYDAIIQNLLERIEALENQQ